MSDTIPVSVSDTNIFVERGYVFNRLLGEGSYAKVWLANYLVENENPSTSTAPTSKEYALACKILDSKKAPRDFVNKFLPREMDVLTKISHPHLIHLHSIYQRKTKFFIFMRYAEKGDLLDHILAHGEVKERQARLWTRQLALGLQYLHNLEIVHRDIKCENVLITANNNVKLADFGFARFMIDANGRRLMSNTYCGSLAYAAPELLKGKPYDPKRSDVWSLGIVLYVMLNQCMPFNDNNMVKLYELQMSSKWSFRSRISQIVSDDVKVLVHNMLTPDALKRILIDDIVNHRWFSHDERLRQMTSREREALEIGLTNRSGLIPRTTRLSIPSWKKRKKDEQIVCMTDLRFERSSNQFQFEGAEAGSTQHKEVAKPAASDCRRTEVKKSEDKLHKRSRDSNTKNSTKRDSKTDSEIELKPKLTTSSVALLGANASDSPQGIHKPNSKTHSSSNIDGNTSTFIPPAHGETRTELAIENNQTEKVVEEVHSLSSDESIHEPKKSS